MELASNVTAAHDFAYRDLNPRFPDPPTLSRPGSGRIANGQLRSLARDAVDPTGPAPDAFRPTSRAARFLNHAPRHSAAPGAAGRIVEALGDDSDVIENFLRTLELLEPFGPGLVRAFIKAVARGIERAAELAAPPAPGPRPAATLPAGEFSDQFTRLDFRLELFSASSELRYGPNGSSYTQQIQYASIQVSFLPLTATGSFSQEVDPLRIEIEGDTLSAAGLDLEPGATADGLFTGGGESSHAPVARAARPGAAIRTNGLLRNDRKHAAGVDGRSPIHLRPPGGLSPPAVHKFLGSLTEGFAPEFRLHI